MTFIRGTMPELYDNQRRGKPKVKPLPIPRVPAALPPPPKKKGK